MYGGHAPKRPAASQDSPLAGATPRPDDRDGPKELWKGHSLKQGTHNKFYDCVKDAIELNNIEELYKLTTAMSVCARYRDTPGQATEARCWIPAVNPIARSSTATWSALRLARLVVIDSVF